MLYYFLHKILRIPLTMRVRYDRKVKNPENTIIFLHGIASSYNVWRATLQKLKQDPALDRTRIVALDLIGFGKSEKPEWFSYKYPDYHRSLRFTIRKLHIKTPIILAGHSMGCLIATDYAVTYPKKISAMILVSPPFMRPSEISKLPDKFYRKTYTSLNEHTSDPIIGTLAKGGTKVSSFDNKALDTTAFRKSMEYIILNPNNWHTIKGVNIPTNIIHGNLDPLVFGANLRSLSKSNRHIKLTESVSAHDIKGPKLNKVVNNIKAILSELNA